MCGGQTGYVDESQDVWRRDRMCGGESGYVVESPDMWMTVRMCVRIVYLLPEFLSVCLEFSYAKPMKLRISESRVSFLNSIFLNQWGGDV